MLVLTYSNRFGKVNQRGGGGGGGVASCSYDVGHSCVCVHVRFSNEFHTHWQEIIDGSSVVIFE